MKLKWKTLVMCTKFLSRSGNSIGIFDQNSDRSKNAESKT